MATDSDGRTVDLDPAVPDRGHVVVVTDRHLFPIREGNRARIVELIRALRMEGLRVTLIIRRFPRRMRSLIPPVRTRSLHRGLVDRLIEVDGDVFHGGDPSAFGVSAYEAVLARAIADERPSAVVAEYLWMAPVLDIVPRDILRIVDTHDVMHLRSEVYRDQPEGAWVCCAMETEVSLLMHGDCVMAIQPREAALLREMLPGRKVIHVPHVHLQPTAPARPSTATRLETEPVVAFVGSRIQGNVVGMTEFIERGWPVAQRVHPQAVLRVYGEICDRLDADGPGIEKMGFVDDLATVYDSATVIINPVRHGTGLKVKTVEALAFGRALVTTPCGADGLMEGAGSAFLVESGMEAFGASVGRLLGDDVHRRSLELEATRFAAERFHPRRAIAELLNVIAGGQADPGEGTLGHGAPPARSGSGHGG
jgi:glycosyltransferase involved in cell wall biosynthesis